MNETKRVSSTARKINRMWVWHLFWVFLWLDVLLLALGTAGWCYAQEHAVWTNAWSPAAVTREVRFPENKGITEQLPGMTYTFTAPDGLSRHVNDPEYFTLLQCMLGVVGIAELFSLLGQWIFGANRVRGKLKPLQKIAIAAQRISEDSHFDEARFHNLEDAISRLSPTEADAKIRTGDRELQGLEEAVNTLVKRMHETYRQQTRFVSDASHELRTPIAVIQGYANMLDRWGKTDEKVLDESIAAIKSESENMKHLVEQLLFLARGDSGRTQLQFNRFSLSAMLREVLEESRMIDPAHQWRFSVPEGLAVVGDEAMLKQTARILVDNAIKYTPEHATITLTGFSDNKGNVCFQVQDEGMGIGGEDAKHMFERFYRSDPARGRQTGGSGLGLAIAKWIIDRHNGYFSVLSREGLGTRITVTLPQEPSPRIS